MKKICVVGRANVGKSTFMNVIMKKKIALASSYPGLTVDKKEYMAHYHDLSFILVDTPGYELNKSTKYKQILEHTTNAIKNSDYVIIMLDGLTGLTHLDKELYFLVKRYHKTPIILVNKIDNFKYKENSYTFYELGESTIEVSLLHNRGLDSLYSKLKTLNLSSDINEDEIKPDVFFSLIGKPNVGKSTIINKLLNENRVLTEDKAGTTRDAIYLNLQYKDTYFKLIDTAGMRRKAKIKQHIEKISTQDTLSAIKFSNVVGLVISTEEGLTKQDLVLAKHVVEEGRALMVIINKIDLIDAKKQSKYLNDIKEDIANSFFQIKEPIIIGISAINEKNQQLINILDVVEELYSKWQTRISTGKFNNFLSEIIDNNPPPKVSGRYIKVKYGVQNKTRPPTFTLWTNNKKGFPTQYLRYLQNKIFAKFDLYGCTIRMQLEKSDNPYKDKK